MKIPNSYIKEGCLSIGYNNSLGQQFFDVLSDYKLWIHSFFFSVTEPMIGKPFDDIDEMINKFKSYETYGIPGNLLFNSVTRNPGVDKLDVIRKVSDVINLKSITILDLDTAIIIKKEFPDLEIHASIRMFDADWENLSKDIFINKIKSFQGICDVVNLSGTYSYNDHELQDLCRSLNMKIKYIVNEGCIINGEKNYNSLPELEQLSCHTYPSCQHVCTKVYEKYYWMHMACNNLFKESLQYMDYDILKISSRTVTDPKIINGLIGYWASNSRTKNISGYVDIRKDDQYDIFLDYVKEISTCEGICGKCLKCKDFYERIISLQ